MLNYSKLFDCIRNLYSFPARLFPKSNAFLPLRYFFELTYRCNLNCPYCYVGDDRFKNELTTDDWNKIINQIPVYSFVTLVGGEPLVRDDFTEILKLTSKQVGGKVSVVTNGVLLYENVIKSMIANNLRLLSVSLDGFGRTHDNNRGKEGLFDTVTGNLERLNLYSKRPMVDIKTIILENNLDDLPELYKYCCENKFEFLSLSFLRINNLKQNSTLRDNLTEEFFAENKNSLYFDIKHFKTVCKELESLSKKGKCIIRFAPKFEYCKNIPKKTEEFFTQKCDIKNKYKPCSFPYSNTYITPEGLVYPCLSVKMGDLKKETLKNIFNSPCYKEFREKIKKEGLLPACGMCCELCIK